MQMIRNLFQRKSAFLVKGIQFVEKNQPKEAISVLTEAIASGDKSADVQYHLGLAHYMRKDVKAAVEAFEASVEIKALPDALVNLGNIYLMKQDNANIKKSIKLFEQALQLAPSDGQIHFNLGVAYEKNGQLDKALQSYRESRDYGVEQANTYFRNVASKLLKVSE